MFVLRVEWIMVHLIILGTFITFSLSNITSLKFDIIYFIITHVRAQLINESQSKTLTEI